MARLKPAHLAELRALHQQAIVALDWLDQHDHNMGHFRTVVDDTLVRQDLRGMRTVLRDFREMFLGLAPSDRARLFKAVEHHTGTSLSDEVQKDAQSCAKFIARGRILNDREYYIARSRLEYVQDDPKRASEASALTELLNQYRG